MGSQSLIPRERRWNMQKSREAQHQLMEGSACKTSSGMQFILKEIKKPFYLISLKIKYTTSCRIRGPRGPHLLKS